MSVPEPSDRGKHEAPDGEADAPHADLARRGKHAPAGRGRRAPHVYLALAARQRGLVARRQLLALGFSAAAIDRLIASSQLHAVMRGVYAVLPLGALPALAREHAAVLAFAPDVWLSHDSAGALWLPQTAAPSSVHVTVVGRNAGQSRPGLVIHNVARLDHHDTREHQGLPITAPARTLLDLTPSLSDRELEQRFDEALVTRIMRRGEVRAMLGRHPGRAGSPRLAALAHEDRSTAWTRSDTERRLLALVRKACLPMPEVNTRFGRFELDFFWREARLAVETDGYAFHSSRRQLERDHRRDLELQAAGVMIVRFSWRQVRDEPEMVVAQIAALLARRRCA
jgi:very-short-patch-repair endonuclease